MSKKRKFSETSESDIVEPEFYKTDLFIEAHSDFEVKHMLKEIKNSCSVNDTIKHFKTNSQTVGIIDCYNFKELEINVMFQWYIMNDYLIAFYYPVSRFVDWNCIEKFVNDVCTNKNKYTRNHLDVLKFRNKKPDTPGVIFDAIFW